MKTHFTFTSILLLILFTTVSLTFASNPSFRIPYADNQLRNLPDPTSTPRINRAEYIAWPANHGNAHVTLWNDDKIAALSLCIDDNHEEEHSIWLDFQKKHGIGFTWFVMTDRAGKPVKWNSFQNVLNQGNDVQSHSVHHLDLKLESSRYPGIFDDEYRPSVTSINTNLIGGKCLSIGYAYGFGDLPTARKYFICARGATGLIDKADNINYMNTMSGAYNDTMRVEALIDPNFKVNNKSYVGDFLVGTYHNVINLVPETDKFLAYISKRKDKIWVDWFTRVCQYGQERDSHTLTVTNVSNFKISFNLTDLMVDSLFDYPLTVKIRVNNDWTSATATQAGNSVVSKMLTYNGNQYVLVKAIPDRGLVEVSGESQNTALLDNENRSIQFIKQKDKLIVIGATIGEVISVFNLKGEKLYSIKTNNSKPVLSLQKNQIFIIHVNKKSFKIKM
jgi:hypothetical protein